MRAISDPNAWEGQIVRTLDVGTFAAVLVAGAVTGAVQAGITVSLAGARAD